MGPSNCFCPHFIFGGSVSKQSKQNESQNIKELKNLYSRTIKLEKLIRTLDQKKKFPLSFFLIRLEKIEVSRLLARKDRLKKPCYIKIAMYNYWCKSLNQE